MVFGENIVFYPDLPLHYIVLVKLKLRKIAFNTLTCIKFKHWFEKGK